VTDDSCSLKFIEIVPLIRDTGDPCTTECDRSDDVKQEYLPVVKQEPHDVCGCNVVHPLFCLVSSECTLLCCASKFNCL